MAGRKPPYFPFYPRDFAADGVVESMTTEQVGAYILLLCKAWSQEPPGSLPQDETVLARWARLSPERWTAVKAGVLAAFTLGTDDRWHQKRMREEFSKLAKLYKAKSDSGKKGAQSRWQSHSAAIGKANDESMASDSGSGSQEEGMQGGKPNRPVLPCDRPDLVPAARKIAELYERDVTNHHGRSIKSILTLLDEGISQADLERAIAGYVRHCKKSDKLKTFRLGQEKFFSQGGEWEKFAKGPETVKEEKWNPVG